MKRERIYEVTFNEYTNCLNKTVRKQVDERGETVYIDIPPGGHMLIRDSDIDKYKDYGSGYKSLTYVGELVEED